MFASIKTSRTNKVLVTELTNKLGLGAENIIARIAFAYSLAEERKFNLSAIQDSQGKEYTSKVLFGDNLDIYVAIICIHYNLYKTDRDIPKYIKMHLDDGLQLIQQQFLKKDIGGIDFMINKIEKGLKQFAY